VICAKTDVGLTSVQQIARMREEYPGFAVLFTTPWIVIWQGELTPYRQRYQVHLLYCATSLPLAGIEANQVHVEVADPILTRRASEPQVSIPHLYPNSRVPTRPRLCLHTPEEWIPTMQIAETIVLWTVEWLAAYEGWKATGTWYAGGHATERERLSPARRVRR
jgi:hypothetical protein